MSAKKSNEKMTEEKKVAEKMPQQEVAEEVKVAEGAAEAQSAEELPTGGEVDVLKSQLAAANDKLMRTLAEYDNYRKRSQRERIEVYPEAVAATVTKLLPVLDNFERALSTESTDAEFKKGVEMIFASLNETLKGIGVEEIDAAGKDFDPNLHNAVMHVEDEALGENTVAMVMQKGYKIGDRVLRHAMVQVAN